MKACEIDTAIPLKIKNLTGLKFGKYTVVGFSHVEKGSGSRRRNFWRCVCVCGNESSVRSDSLLSGVAKSCGCHRAHFVHAANLRHGGYSTIINDSDSVLLRSVWQAMRDRCERPSHESYKDYGGRGIKVCDRWKSFPIFLQDMKDTYARGLTLERKDVHGDYCPDNCKWATRAEQARNTRRNRVIEMGGVSMCLTDWCMKLGLVFSTTRHRLNRGHPLDVVFHPGKITPSGRKL